MALLLSREGDKITLEMASLQETLDGEDFFYNSHLQALKREEEKEWDSLAADIELMFEVLRIEEASRAYESDYPLL